MQQKQHEIHNLQNTLNETRSNAERNHARLMKEKEDEIHNLQNMLTNSTTMAEKNQARLIKEKETKDQAINERNRLITAKDKEMQTIIQKYQDLETKSNQLGQNFSQMEQNYKQQMSQYKKDVSTEALRLAGQITKEKDEEIQQLTEELNRYKYKPGESLSRLGGMFQSLGDITEGVMEEELPKAYPGSLNLEENKEHTIQTRSKGPVSFGEEIRREIVDEQGNIIWKGTEHLLAGKQYTTAEYVLNFIKYASTQEIISLVYNGICSVLKKISPMISHLFFFTSGLLDPWEEDFYHYLA